MRGVFVFFSITCGKYKSESSQKARCVKLGSKNFSPKAHPEEAIDLNLIFSMTKDSRNSENLSIGTRSRSGSRSRSNSRGRQTLKANNNGIMVEFDADKEVIDSKIKVITKFLKSDLVNNELLDFYSNSAVKCHQSSKPKDFSKRK